MQIHYPLNPSTGAEDPTQLPWTNGVPSTGTDGSFPPYQLCVNPQTELINLITAAGITPADSDMFQVGKAIQSGQLVFSPASGGVNAYTAVLSPVPSALTTGFEILVYFGTPNTSLTPTLNLNALGAKTIIKQGGSAVAAGDLSGYIPLIYDGTSWRINGLVASDVPIVATANVVLYVLPSGSDTTGTGTAGNPFATILGAMYYAAQRLSFGGYSLTIQLGASGTYAAPGIMPVIAGAVIIRGNPGSQSTYIVSGAGPVGGSGGLFDVFGGTVQLIGVTVQNTGAANNSVLVGTGGSLFLQNVTFQTTVGTTFAHIATTFGGTLTVGSGCIIQGNAGQLLSAQGGTIILTANINVPANYVFTNVALAINGTITVSTAGLTFTGTGGSGGGSTGQRYYANLNAVINTAGGGATFFPGSTAGGINAGGQYQ